MQNKLLHKEQSSTGVPDDNADVVQAGFSGGTEEKRILIVDDFEPIAIMLQCCFENEGSVEIAENGLEALHKVKNHHFDVIISDVNMPLMDGIEFYQRAIESDPQIKDRFVFVTGSDTEAHVDFFLTHNIRFMIKPPSIRELKKVVSGILQSAASG